MSKPAPVSCIALLRGINVGRAKRVAMADLRALLEGLGYADVRTLLNSGNAIFRAPPAQAAQAAPAIEAALQRHCGFAVPTVVIGSVELEEIVAANPLAQAASDPSRFLVAFVGAAATLDSARPLLSQRWEPEALALGRRAAYLWCADGIIGSRLGEAFARCTAQAATTRNWATVLKLRAAATERHAR